MLKPKQIKQLKEEIDFCKRPLIIFDGDNDGLTSYLQLYRYLGEGKGVILKAKPKVTEAFVRRVQEYQPDKIFIFDIAEVEQEFIDNVNVPIYWFDHHGPFDPSGKHVKYINPLHWKESTSPCVMIYQICQKDLWIAAVGAIADYQIPYFWDEVMKKYPELVGKKKPKNPNEIRFGTKLGTLIKVFSFNLKGTTSDAMKSIRILTRIESPDEILNQTSSQGKFLWKKYEKYNKEYEKLRKRAFNAYKKDDKIMFFKYNAEKTSFTKDLADDMMHHHQDRVIILARERQGKVVMSIRASEKMPEIRDAVVNSMNGLQGAGGGHPRSCGANVQKEDFKEFLKRFREELSL